MGEDVEAQEFSRADRTRYREKVHRCLDTFARMLSEHQFDTDDPMTGLEVEFNLVDELGDPALKNAEALAAIADPDFQTELGQFNIEINVPPAKLREGGLVSARRSLADGRDSYYVLELAHCGALLAGAGASLHPGLATAAGRYAGGGSARARVLFLCTGNSARSQMAEALAEQLSAGAVRAVSAGSHPMPLHPNAVHVMRERGRRLVAPLFVFLQRGHHDQVEITAQVARDRRRRPQRRLRRNVHADDAFDLGWRFAADIIRPFAREQHVQQDA